MLFCTHLPKVRQEFCFFAVKSELTWHSGTGLFPFFFLYVTVAVSLLALWQCVWCRLLSMKLAALHFVFSHVLPFSRTVERHTCQTLGAGRRSLHAFGEWCQKNAERDPHRSYSGPFIQGLQCRHAIHNVHLVSRHLWCHWFVTSWFLLF